MKININIFTCNGIIEHVLNGLSTNCGQVQVCIIEATEMQYIMQYK